ncbi:transcription antitermination factor NusG [Gemmobacter caeni]|uniref:Transcription antitermination factor NusG n=1 Tax=Gemmobacter caeni TaxID=589035 RepID=A0A2T6A4H0_9RHOB|nr:transcription termination/antitermination NusG family protein [Gemmobacter caeni]PTX38709.1 transcription antitermination factor NusG [Gemmobacter caeni]TWJ05769.1 transcription antitermination factor NusG [Gemmobacter caeni]
MRSNGFEQTALRIGDVLPPRDVAGIVLPGPSRWYALRVAPQREDEVEGWLRKRGVYAFHPVLKRQTRARGVVRTYHRRYLPGYVFARFCGDPVVHMVMSCPWVIGALCRADGHWGVLEPSRLQAIHAMRKRDERIERDLAADQLRRREASRMRAGDHAMFRVGPFAELPCEVVELVADGGVRLRFQLFGREVVVDGVAEDLVPLRKAG